MPRSRRGWRWTRKGLRRGCWWGRGSGQVAVAGSAGRERGGRDARAHVRHRLALQPPCDVDYHSHFSRRTLYSLQTWRNPV
eukprot:2424273-Rhodomonas_salina.1